MNSSEQQGAGARPVVILTRAGGLGSTFCRKYSARYQIVAVWHRRRPVAATRRQYLLDPLEPERQLAANRHPVHDIQVDLRSDRQLKRLVKMVISRYHRVDSVVNAAVAGYWAPLLNGHSRVAEVTSSLSLNVAAPLALVAEVARQAWQCGPAEISPGTAAWSTCPAPLASTSTRGMAREPIARVKRH